MKRIAALLIAVLLALNTSPVAWATPSCAAGLVPTFPPNQAVKLCSTFNSTSISASLIPTVDNTYDLGDLTHSFRLLYLATGRITKTSDILEVRQDANRLFTWDGSSDTALTMKFGDGGTTAVQQLTISASTSDADDDSSLILAGGGADGGTRGASITLPGEEVSGGSDITYNAGTGDTHLFQVAGTTEVTIADDALTFSGAAASIVGGATSLTIGSAGSTILDAQNDPQRLLTYSATSDTALTLKYGDAGVTAVQALAFTAGTSDADDDATLCLSGGGACTSTNNSRGSFLYMEGADVGGANTGSLAIGGTNHVRIYSGSASSLALDIADTTAATFASTITSSGASLGWSYVTGANTACTTTCASAAAFGVDLAGGATAPVIVGPADASADACVCAGAS